MLLILAGAAVGGAGCSLHYGDYDDTRLVPHSAQVADMTPGDGNVERRAPGAGNYILTYVYRDGRRVPLEPAVQLYEGEPLGFRHTPAGIEAFAASHSVLLDPLTHDVLSVCWVGNWHEPRLVTRRGWYWSTGEASFARSRSSHGGGAHFSRRDEGRDRSRSEAARTASDRGARYGDSSNNNPDTRQRTRD